MYKVVQEVIIIAVLMFSTESHKKVSLNRDVSRNVDNYRMNKVSLELV